MDVGILAAVTMLIVWGIGTFAFEAPGWIHGLLSFGVFLLIYRIVVRGTPRPEARGQKPEGSPESRVQSPEPRPKTEGRKRRSKNDH
jgi:hypothetical protein